MTNGKLRILFLFAHLHKGGMQRAVSNISRALPEEYEQFVGYFGTEDPGFEFKAVLHDFNIPGSLETGLPGKLCNYIRRLSALRTFVSRNRIDLVVSFGEPANIINIASRHAGKKIISMRVALEEALWDTGRYKQLYLWLVRLLYRRADAVVTNSKLLTLWAKEHISKISGPITIPNLYHADEIRRLAAEPLPGEFQFLESRGYILNVGSLIHQKGQDDLLRAFSLVHRHCPDIYLVIVGSGDLRAVLEDLAVSLAIRDQVVFVDFDRNPYRFMARAAVFALTSRYEGFPNVLVEAMICGCPVVAFDCPTGPAEILGDSDYGILLKERSVSALAEELSLLLTDENKNCIMRDRSSIGAARYSSEHIIKSWQRVIDDVTH